MARAVISTIGHDRPGIVNSLTALVHDMHLNIEDTRAMVLGDEFAVLMSVSGDSGALDEFSQKLTELCTAQGLMHLFRRTTDRAAQPASVPYRFSVVAMDHPGIVHAVSRFFSDRAINIQSLETGTQPAAHTGTPIFDLQMVLEVPASANVCHLRGVLDEFCEANGIDGELQPHHR